MATTKRSDAMVIVDSPKFVLESFFWPCRPSSVSQWLTLPVVLMSTALFQWATGIWPYSGMQEPPMYGDFEAQRHWMELTINLPMTHWYFHDLDWWGLDYPPLTAYHSWICGQIGAYIEPIWFALYTSRGADDHDLKVFMRGTVMASEYLIYVPAIVLCVRQLSRRQGVQIWDANIALAAILMQPATMLVDHGHFQYNTVMLGFGAAALASISANKPHWSCFFFVAALGFKQMALFYAPVVASYLAGITFIPRFKPSLLLSLAITTLASFGALFLPLLLGTVYDSNRSVPLPTDAKLPPQLDLIPFPISKDAWYGPYVVQLAQVVHRVFPFARGLFEDKVANLWCAIHSSGLHKLNHYDSALLSKAALGLTLCSIAPACLIIFIRPKRELVPLAMATCAWGFFMCSYQVHEKNVLLPLLPMTLLLASKNGLQPATRMWVAYANIVACWTLFPLLSREQLRIPYFVLTFLWAWSMGISLFDPRTLFEHDQDMVSKLIHVTTYLGIVIWHILEATIKPPPGMPDLWVVANVCSGAAAFGFCYLWCLWNLVDQSGILNFRTTRRIPKSKKLL